MHALHFLYVVDHIPACCVRTGLNRGSHRQKENNKSRSHVDSDSVIRKKYILYFLGVIPFCTIINNWLAKDIITIF